MQVDDLKGSSFVATDSELLNRLRTIRKGTFGAFTLSHQTDSPSLHIYINDEFAYIHYFANNTSDNAGYQAAGMTPSACPESVYFVQTDGSESYAFEMPS